MYFQAEIKEKVSFMGGVYTTNLCDSVTHLVTDAVRSAKYEVIINRWIGKVLSNSFLV
jgi:hypothetical protein